MLPKELKKLKPKLFDRGKRGLIYIFKKNNKLYCIKIQRPNIEAKNRISNEAKFLRFLNKKNIGPKLIKSKDNYIIYEFVKGKFIQDYLDTTKAPKKIILNILSQCRTLDELKINKLEMHHPVKHILIYKNKPVMIDFERCYFTKKPKNTTQFIQYLTTKKIVKSTKKLRLLLKEYKNNQNDKNYKKLILALFLH